MPRDVASLRGEGQGKSQGDHALSGLTVEPLPPGEAGGNGGVVISRVEPNSPAERAGLQKADIILEINRKEVRSINDFERLTNELDSKSTVLALLKRGRGTIFLSIKP